MIHKATITVLPFAAIATATAWIWSVVWDGVTGDGRSGHQAGQDRTRPSQLV